MMRVLIAEDDTIIHLDLLGLLESNQEAVELAAVLGPDAILMDIKISA
jgi:hypothetical protein